MDITDICADKYIVIIEYLKIVAIIVNLENFYRALQYIVCLYISLLRPFLSRKIQENP